MRPGGSPTPAATRRPAMPRSVKLLRRLRIAAVALVLCIGALAVTSYWKS